MLLDTGRDGGPVPVKAKVEETVHLADCYSRTTVPSGKTTSAPSQSASKGEKDISCDEKLNLFFAYATTNVLKAWLGVKWTAVWKAYRHRDALPFTFTGALSGKSALHLLTTYLSSDATRGREITFCIKSRKWMKG